MFKNKLKKRCTSVAMMKEELQWIWSRDITRDLCKTGAQSMPRKLMAVLEANGGHAKYSGVRKVLSLRQNL